MQSQANRPVMPTGFIPSELCNGCRPESPRRPGDCAAEG